jgi:hypothetical protein
LRHDHEARADVVAAIGGEPPALDVVVPADRSHLGGEDRSIVEPEVLPDVFAVLEDLGAVGVLLRGNEIEFFEHRDVAVGIVVALNAGEPIPVPDTAEIAAHLDDVHIVDARLLQIGARKQSCDATAENRDLDVLVDRRARRDRRVRIDLGELREVVFEFQILRCAFGSQAFVALVAVLLPQGIDVDVIGRLGRPACVEQGHLSS